MRHGQTLWNEEGRFQGTFDSPLTKKGEAQAIEMGSKLRSHGVSAQSYKFCSSPQRRSLETARLALGEIGSKVVPDPRLREISVGAWNGLTREEIQKRWPGPEDEHFVEMYARAPGGESFESVWDRVGDFLESLRSPTVIFTHGFTSRMLRTRAMGLSLAELDELPGGQGVIFHLYNGQHNIL